VEGWCTVVASKTSVRHYSDTGRATGGVVHSLDLSNLLVCQLLVPDMSETVSYSVSDTEIQPPGRRPSAARVEADFGSAPSVLAGVVWADMGKVIDFISINNHRGSESHYTWQLPPTSHRSCFPRCIRLLLVRSG
jgi:hypothetical protein